MCLYTNIASAIDVILLENRGRILCVLHHTIDMNDIFYKFLWQTKTERKIEVSIETDGYGISE
jgi:hypothetical protein